MPGHSTRHLILRLPVARFLGIVRIVFGLWVWLYPRGVTRTFGLVVGDNSDLVYPVRLYAVRDAIFGCGTLLSRGAARRLWLGGSLVCDIADGAAAGAAARRRDMSTRAFVMLMTASVAGLVVSGLALASEHERTVRREASESLRSRA